MPFLEIQTMFGLPAHALVVHAAVILVPLAAVALMATGWRAPWRRIYTLPVMALAILGAVSAWMAVQSGEPVEHQVRRAAEQAGAGRPRFGEHPEMGERAQMISLLFALFVVALFVVDRWGGRWKLSKWAPTATYAVAAVFGGLALLSMVAAGHSGAELVWKDVGTFAAAK